jgi:hypothetical protein
MKILIFLITPLFCFGSHTFKVAWISSPEEEILHIEEFSSTGKYIVDQKDLGLSGGLFLKFKRENKKSIEFDGDSIETKESALKLWRFIEAITGRPIPIFDKDLKEYAVRNPHVWARSPYSKVEKRLLLNGFICTSYQETPRNGGFTVHAFFTKIKLD